MVNDLNFELAQKLYHVLCVHNEEPGGIFASVVGWMGCGKTTLLQRTVPKFFYFDSVDRVFEKETIIWRARAPVDFWNYFLDPSFEWEDPRYKRPVQVFRHKDDAAAFQLERSHSVLPMPRPIEYTDSLDLYGKLVPGAINVVYEPPEYFLSEPFLKMFRAKAHRPFRDLSEAVDGVLFWHEFIYTLMQEKGPEFYSLVLDEADEMFANNPTGADYHLHKLFRESARDFRKAGLTALMTFHKWGDIDWMISSKIVMHGWMRGDPPPGFSLLRANSRYVSLARLPIGRVIWEMDGFGHMDVPKIEYRERVRRFPRITEVKDGSPQADSGPVAEITG